MDDPETAIPTRPSPQSQVILHALRLGFRPVIQRAPVPIGVLRVAVDGGSRLLRLDRHVRVAAETAAPVAGEWLRTDDSDAPAHSPDSVEDAALLYLHGGAYVFCSPRTHRVITSRLALDSGLPVFVPKYRLAPEHPFPAAIDDAIDAYRWLLERGIPAERIVVAGDSAGGHLAATLAVEVCRLGLPSPAGIALFSPWADLTCELSIEWDRECRDPYIVPALGRRFGLLYAGEHDFDDPRLGLLKCNTSELPPFLIQAGGSDALRSDAEHLAEVLTEIGVNCELQIWPGQMHVFQALHKVVPEARAAIQATARFARTVIGDEQASAAA